MKTFFITCAITCAALFTCFNKTYAQDAKPRFGIQAGIDWMTLGSTTQGGTKFDYAYQAGFQGGVNADIPLTSKVSFMPQILYTQKGGQINDVLYTSAYNIVINSKISYLDVPLLIGFKPQPNLTFSVGPQVAFFLRQQSVLNVSDGNTSQSNAATSNDLRKLLIGGNVGVGYMFTNNIGLSLHYSIDFQNAGDGNTDNNTGERNSGFALSVSYLF